MEASPPRVPHTYVKDTRPQKAKVNEMSINEYVETLIKKSEYGLKDYTAPSNEMLLKKLHLGKSDKS